MGGLASLLSNFEITKLFEDLKWSFTQHYYQFGSNVTDVYYRLPFIEKKEVLILG
jgi:hypothetical protein